MNGVSIYYPPAAPASGASGLTDAFSLKIGASDTNAAPTDASTFAISLLQAETNPTPTETAQLKFPAPDFGDTNPAPSESRSVTLRVWLSGTVDVNASGVTNPNNANGANDGALCTLTSVVTGNVNPKIRSNIGSNIGTITFSTVVFRGWFRARTTLITSTARVVAHSSSALFTDIIMFTQSTLNGDTNNLTGTFTFDLFAAGVNTLAKLQSLQIVHETIDAAAGVTPAILDVDAGAADIIAVI